MPERVPEGLLLTSWETIAEAIPGFVFLSDANGRNLRTNGWAQRYAGLTAQALLGDGWLPVIHPDDRAETMKVWRCAVETGAPYDIEYRLRRHDGGWRWFLCRGLPVRDDAGRITHWIGVAFDVDERRRANEAMEACIAERTTALQEANRRLQDEIAERRHAERVLKDSETRYRNLYNRTPLALQSIDGNARLIDVNDSWLDLFGFTREEVLGRSPPEFMTPDSARRFRERAWPELLASRGAVRAMEYRFIKRSGEEFDGRIVARGEFDAGQRFVRSWSVIADITAEKRTELALRQAQKIEAVGQLTSGIAHDFNNLLTAVLGNLEMLASRLEPDKVQAQRLVANARQAAERGAALTTQLLAFSRKQRLMPEPVDVNRIIQGMGELLQSTIGATIRIDTILADPVWPALADPMQLELVVLNLAINARDAMKRGGAITIETANTTLGAPLHAEEPVAGDYVVVAVSDTGTGMTPAVLDRVFEPFFTTKEVGKGSGLGLPQVLGVAQQLGGGMRIDSQPGRGTEVRVYLPRVPATGIARPMAAAAQPQRSPGRGAEATILLVDDDSDVRAVSAEMLRGAGHAVIEASSGATALERLEREGDRIDLMVVDVAMPGMTGVELAKRARRERSGLPVVFMTGFADATMLAEAAGPDAILRKPFDEGELAAMVARALGGTGDRDAAAEG